MTELRFDIQLSTESMRLQMLNSTLRGQRIRLKAHLKTTGLWICCLFTAVVFACDLKWCFGGTGRRAKRMLWRFEGLELIIKSRFPKLKYSAHSFLSSEMFVRCFWSEKLNTGTVAAPSGSFSNCRGQYHCTNDEIQHMYRFVPSTSRLISLLTRCVPQLHSIHFLKHTTYVLWMQAVVLEIECIQ